MTHGKRLLFAATLIILSGTAMPPGLWAEPVTVKVFHSVDCPYCVEALAYLRDLQQDCPDVVIEDHEVHEERGYWQQYTREHNLPEGLYPLLVIDGKGFLGFMEGDGPLERDPSGKGFLGYSTQIVRAIEEAGASCDFDAFLEGRSAGPGAEQGSGAEDGRGAEGSNGPEGAEASRPPEDQEEAVRAAEGGATERRLVWLLAVIPVYLAGYLLLRRLLKDEQKRVWWIAGLVLMILLVGGAVLWSLPEQQLRAAAESLPFPGFVAIIALADGFNPCAFTVLIILLSLLTHLRRREAMLLVAGTFVLTSALFYAIFILAFAFLGGLFFGSFGAVILRVLGALVLGAGIINLLDGLGRPIPLSLSLTSDQQTRLSRRAGNLVTRLKKPGASALLATLGGTVVLASAANLAELGCTAVLPLVFIARLFGRFGSTIGAQHLFWTAVYAGLYVVPLAAVAGASILLLRRGRMGQAAGQALKVAGGALMIAFGLAMLLRPEILSI